jgi:metal-responsive CopG/Arc/MetJ family transcriptional regulator
VKMVSVRLTERTVEQLDTLAAERGTNRTRVARQLLEAGLRDRPAPSSEPPSEEELIALLAEGARRGNVSAIRSLLVREHEADPRARAITLFQSMIGAGDS